jgi:sugar lactone lactonase YvrE
MKHALLFMIAGLELSAAQLVTTLAGGGALGTSAGFTDGLGTAALFTLPYGLAVDPSGTVFVADYSTQKIRAVSPGQTVTTFAGSSAGLSDGIGTSALFNGPLAVSANASGFLYVVDFANNRIRVISPSRVVTTLAGSTSGSADGVGTFASFYEPCDVAVSTSGAVYVADRRNNKIRLVYPNRTTATVVGGGAGGTASGAIDGVGTSALFSSPFGVAVDGAGVVFVSDTANNKIRRVANLTVTTIAGGGATGNAAGSSDGSGTGALFSEPLGLAVGASGVLYVADKVNNRIRAVYLTGRVVTLAGGGATGVLPGAADGVGTGALFTGPARVAVGSSGAVLVADTNSNKIRVISPAACLPGSYLLPGTPLCEPCPAGSFSAANATTCAPCPAGSFSSSAGAASCQPCPRGHACPSNGTTSWARLNCGRGSFCPAGSAAPTPCPLQVPPAGGWGARGVQGPAFLVETAACLNHCFWNFTAGADDGLLSKC